MTVTTPMPVRILNLVSPLPHKGTAMHVTDTSGHACQVRCSLQVDRPSLRPADVDSEKQRSPLLTTPGFRTSKMETRTTTTRTTSCKSGSPADSPFSFEDLATAYFDCRRNKANTRSALAFEAHLERNLCDLQSELIDGSYAPGKSICFVVTHPKPREVWAADFRDRVVHHLLYNRIAPRFYAAFTADTCACIPGRGTLYGAQRLEHQVRSITQNWTLPAHYLKCDIANFFVSIKKDVLRAQLARRIHESWWLHLAELILYHDPRTDYELRGAPQLVELVPDHKRLVNAPANTGLPIGNLSSQFFANVLLDDLDQHVKHRLRCRHYVRYVDDFILLDSNPDKLNAALTSVREFLPSQLGVTLNPRKTILQPVDRGIDFVGHVIRPWRRSTRSRTVRMAVQRIESLPTSDLHATGNSYFGLLGQASHSQTDRTRLARAIRRRGSVINGDITKTYRRAP